KKQHPFLNFFFKFAWSKPQNINHTCPFNPCVLFVILVFQESMFSILPLHRATIWFNVKSGAYKDWKASVKVYFHRNDTGI
ncbi:hypothetical protein CVS40_11805, partial [Lucilia cuprina]